MSEHTLYELEKDSRVDPILENLRLNIARGEAMGVTLIGNRLTCRWSDTRPGKKRFLLQVHMVILEVDDGIPEPPESTPK